MRRAFDLVASTCGLILLSPVLVAVAVAIRFLDGGPIVYRSLRAGRDGEPFVLYKFRTMSSGAAGPGITAADDARITTIGRMLRKTKLDELPQLVNVMKGEMSVVGPRPEDPKYVDQYTAAQRHVLEYRPGMTSAASIAFRNEEDMLSSDSWEETYLQEILPAKIAIDLEYFRRRTLWSDVKIMLLTLPLLFNVRSSRRESEHIPHV